MGLIFFFGLTVFNRAPSFLFTNPILFMLGLALAMYLMLEAGRWLGGRHLTKGQHLLKESLSVIDGPIFALFGLLVAFTFSSSLSHYDERRKLIIEEANDIGTAYLRLDLLPSAERLALQDLFRSYADSRIKTYALFPDLTAVIEEYSHSQELQGKIWRDSVAAAHKTDSVLAGMQLLPALNAMIDITNTRAAWLQMHPPAVIFLMLVMMALVTAILAGYQMAATPNRCWLHITMFVVAITVTCYVIVDIEYPRVGLIRTEAADALLRDVRAEMGK